MTYLTWVVKRRPCTTLNSRAKETQRIGTSLTVLQLRILLPLQMELFLKWNGSSLSFPANMSPFCTPRPRLLQKPIPTYTCYHKFNCSVSCSVSYVCDTSRRIWSTTRLAILSINIGPPTTLFTTIWHSLIKMHLKLNQSLVESWGWFYSFVIINSAAMNILEDVSTFFYDYHKAYTDI